MVPGSEEGETSGSLANILNLNTEVGLESVFGQVKNSSKERKFSESVELILKLNVDPSKGNQMVRGTCILPAGLGTEVRIAVFADFEFHHLAKEAGADILGSADILSDIATGKCDFDKIIATPE